MAGRKNLAKIFEILVSTDVRQFMYRISEDGACSACVAINVDECRSLDAIVALPTDREGGISLVDVDRFGVAIPGQSCSELAGRVKQPRIARFAREQDELTDADHTSR